MNKRINKIHEKGGRLVYKNETNLSFDGVMKKDKSVSIHQRNMKILDTNIFKMRNDLGPEIMKDIFHFVQKPYNLRNDSTLQRRRNRAVYFGIQSTSSLAPKIWQIVLCDIKKAKSLDILKKNKKNSGQQVNARADFAKRILTI